MACTATATEQVGREISARLGLRDPHTLRAGFDRPNLSFDVITLAGAGSKARKQMLLSLALSDPSMRPAIVYCGTRREVEEVTEQLCADGPLAVGYHAGMPADQRAAAQHRFMTGDADVVVATNAFGMGVDKADVRCVVHWAIPKSVEAYYQEVGRAGRDGLPARAILLASRADLGRLINFIKGDAVEPGDVMAYVGWLRAAGRQRSAVGRGTEPGRPITPWRRSRRGHLAPAAGARCSSTSVTRARRHRAGVAAISATPTASGCPVRPPLRRGGRASEPPAPHRTLPHPWIPPHSHC